VSTLPGNARRRRRGLSGTWLLVPNWAWTLLFFVIPLIFVVVYSLGTRGTYGGIVFGLDLSNYAKVWDRLYLEVFARSFAMAVGSTVLCVLVGFPLAYYMAFKAGAKRNLLLFALIVPFFTSLLVRSYAWMGILNDEGLLNDVLNIVGLPDTHLLNRWPAIVIGMVYSYLPMMVLPLFVALDRIDTELLNAARDLGASDRRVFRRITLKLAVPGILAGTLLVAIPAMGEYLIPALLGGGKELMIGNLIGIEFIQSQNWPLGSALSVVLMAVLLVFVAVYLRFAAKDGRKEMHP
jgi:spermidine/putrescine transport system permease protein